MAETTKVQLIHDGTEYVVCVLIRDLDPGQDEGWTRWQDVWTGDDISGAVLHYWKWCASMHSSKER